MTIEYDKQTQDNFKILKGLNWPTEHYRVFGGGIMSALGLKPWRDIDLIVSEEFFEVIREEYGNQYWYSEDTHLPIHFHELPIEVGRFPLDLERNHPGLFDLNSFWNDYIMIEDVPFILMRHTHAYKLKRKNSEYVEVETKDQQHIKLIEDYLTFSKFGY